jgi:eukaryotic-like serine/threonine-protein kinase
VVGILDVGALPTGLPYMVMEFLEGQDLSELVKQQGKVPVAQAVEYILQACEALAEAHSLGIIHRDLKPSNIYVTRRPDGTEVIKLLDFGIAKVTPTPEALEQEHALTTGTALMGSPLYMSPDQLRSSRETDGRTDIWCLGAILHKLITGRPPFMAATVPQLCTMILTEPVETLRSQVPDAPAELEAVVLKCLEKRPEDRFQNVAQLALALASFAPQRAQVSVDRAVRVIGAAGGDVGRPLIAVTGPPVPPAAPSSAKAVAVDSPTRLRPEGLKSGSLSAVRPSAAPVPPPDEETPPRPGKLVALSAFLAAVALASLVVVTLGRAHMLPGVARALPRWISGAPAEVTTAPPPPIELAPIVNVASPLPDPAAPAAAPSSASSRPQAAPSASAAPPPSLVAPRPRWKPSGHRAASGDDEFGGRK